MELVAGARHVVSAHVDALVAQLSRIVAEGVVRGELDVAEPEAAARAVFDATARFHNPVHAAEWTDPSIDAAYEDLLALVLRGLGAKGG